MVEINLGSVVSQNGRTTVNGLASGLDTEALIEGILSARQGNLDDIADSIETNNEKISLIGEFRTILETFRSAAEGLRNPPGINNDSSNFFAYRSVNVSATDSETYLSATAEPGANIGSFTISDVDLAKTHIIRRDGFTTKTGSVVADADVTNDYSASFTLNNDNGTLNTTTPITFSNAIDTPGTAATINVVFGSQNIFDAGDTLQFGSEQLTFGGGGGNDLDISGAATLEEKLEVIVNHLNSLTTGEAADYIYEVSGGDTIVVTRNQVGADGTIEADIRIQANFSTGATDTTQTVAIGDVAATNGATSGFINTNGTDGTDDTLVSDANTVATTTLAGAFSSLSATYTAGSDGGDGSFTSNTISFTVTIGGETYTSNDITLLDGSIDADTSGNGDGAGDNGFGNRIAAGTVITFTKDVQTGTGSQADVTFQFTTGSADLTVDNSTDADTLATNIQTFLDDNTVSVTQESVEPFRPGTFELGGVEITLAEGDTLTEIRSKINAVSNSSGVSAEIIEVSSGSFSLQLKATTTGTANAIAEFAAGSLTFGGDVESFTETQAAEDATFTFDGLAITRSTNTFDDLIDNVSISLLQDSGAVESTLEITENDTVAQNGIVDFLNAYNDLKTFVAIQTERDDNGALVETAVLGNESILRETVLAIDTQLNELVEGLSDDAIQTLFNVGISFTDFEGDDETPPVANIFEVDFDLLENAFANDFDEVRRLFEFDFVSNSTELSVFETSNNITLTSFKLDIDESRAVGEQVHVLDADTDEFLFYAEVSNTGLIVGADGTAIEGLKLVYTGDGTDVINVSLSQGAADKIFNVLDSILEDDTGALDVTLDDLLDEADDLEDDQTDITEEIAAERDRLLERFAGLEAAISQFNNILTFLEAQRLADAS